MKLHPKSNIRQLRIREINQKNKPKTLGDVLIGVAKAVKDGS